MNTTVKQTLLNGLDELKQNAVRDCELSISGMARDIKLSDEDKHITMNRYISFMNKTLEEIKQAREELEKL